MNHKKNKLTIWDTSENFVNYPKNIQKIYLNFYVKERIKFTDWIGKISIPYKDNLDWWSSPPASRNLYLSDLYKNICIIKTVDLLKKKNSLPHMLITNSIALKKILERRNIKILINVPFLYQPIFKKIFFLLKTTKTLFLFLFKFIILNILIKKRNYIPKKIILIDTYITDCKKKEERFYGSSFSKKICKINKIYFVPTIIQNKIFEFFKIALELKKYNKYLFKESYVNISDVFYCFFYILRRNYFLSKYMNYNKFNLTDLIHEELKYISNMDLVFLSLMNYSFAKRLKDNSIIVKKSINWFENQPCDKGWNLGFAKYFKNIILLGYQGFSVYPEYMCLNVSKSELAARVIPDKIIITSNSFKVFRKEFCKKIKIITGPALRKHSIKKKYTQRKYKVVIFLEGLLNGYDNHVIEKFIRIAKKNLDINFYIKSHPNLPLREYNYELPKNLIETNIDFSKLASNTEVAVSYGSSSCTLESIEHGCKILIPIDNPFDEMVLRSLKISRRIYDICPTFQTLDKYFTKFIIKSNKTFTFNSNNINNNNNIFKKKNQVNFKMFL